MIDSHKGHYLSPSQPCLRYAPWMHTADSHKGHYQGTASNQEKRAVAKRPEPANDSSTKYARVNHVNKSTRTGSRQNRTIGSQSLVHPANPWIEPPLSGPSHPNGSLITPGAKKKKTGRLAATRAKIQVTCPIRINDK